MVDDDKYYKTRLQRMRRQRLISLKNALNTVDCFALGSLPPEDYNSLQRIRKDLIKTHSQR